MHYNDKIERQETIIFCLDDFVPQDHNVRLIDKIVNNIIKEGNLFSNYQSGKSDLGRRAYNPSDLLKLFIYGYIYGVSSSRRLEEECQKNLHLKWLVNGITPGFRKICYFREQNGKEIEKFFDTFVKQLFLNNLASNKLFATDGVKIKGYVSKTSMNKEELEKYKKEVTDEMNKYLTELNDSEDKELKQKSKRKIYSFTTKLARIKKCEERLESNEKALVNPGDPDSALLNNHGNRFRGYNTQATVDSKGKYVINLRITNKSNDSHELYPTLRNIFEKLGITPEKIVADKGYNTISEVFKSEDEFNVSVITELQKIDEEESKSFIYQPDKDIYICPNKQKMVYKKTKIRDNGRKVRVYVCNDCIECPFRKKCTDSKNGRQFTRSETIERETIFREKIKTESNQKILNQRKGLIENVFGVIRPRMGFIPLYLRGIEKATIEIFLYFIGYNITRYINNFKKALSKGLLTFFVKFLMLYIFNTKLKNLDLSHINSDLVY